jgi:hypothetical protein
LVAASTWESGENHSHLLLELPATETYRIVFMRRDINEVLASQAAMIARRGAPAQFHDDLRNSFIAHLKKLDSWLAERENMSTLHVNYTSIIAAPLVVATRVNQFLRGDVNGLAM